MWIVEQRFTVTDPKDSGTNIYGPYFRLQSAKKAAKLLRRDGHQDTTITRVIRLIPTKHAV